MGSGWGRTEPDPERCVVFTRWVSPPSPHPVAREYGPNVPACFFAVWPLAVQTAGSFGHVEPEGYVALGLLMSRN